MIYTALIADDAKVICDSIASALRQALPELKLSGIFQNGADAYDYVQTHPVDILLLDIEMPGRSGLDIAKLVHENHPDTYVIILTAFRNFEYAKKAIEYHVDAFLNKPFTSQQLIGEVQKAIALLDARGVLEADNRNMYRALLHSFLVSDKETPLSQELHGENLPVTERYQHQNLLSDTELRLCQNTTPITELVCTEVTFSYEGLSLTPSGNRSTLFRNLCRTLEYDTRSQSAFLMECTDYWVKLLLFSKGTPDVSGLTDAERIIASYTDNAPQCSVKTFPSFMSYRTEQIFSKKMDHFFKGLASDHPKHAKEELVNYLHTLNEEECAAFGNFLTEHYQIDLTPENPQSPAEKETTIFNENSKAYKAVSDKTLCQQSFRPEYYQVLQNAIDTLFRRTLDTTSGNYLVEAAKEYIDTHYHSSDLSLESTADALSVSRVYLSRLFKKYTSQNFSDYLLKLRLEHAKTLLRSTAMPTIEISEAVGYGNSVYFRNSFKNHTGMTPRQYRQLHYGKEGQSL